MNRRLSAGGLVALLTVCLGCGSAAVHSSSPSVAVAVTSVESGSGSIDYDELAEQIVGPSAAVREGELVQVLGTVDDDPLMEALAVAIRRRGAFPLLTLTSERLEQRIYEKVSERYDTQPPRLELQLAEILSAIIDLVPESEEVHPGVAPVRIARVFASRRGLHERLRERGVRQVSVGNELYPSRARAERYGMPFEALARNYWHGLAIDAAVMRARADWTRDLLARARAIEVTNPNGTRITMSIAGRKLLVSDGLLSDEQLEAGGENVMVWLPAGELYAAPVLESVNGTVVVDRLVFQDTRIEGLRLDFVRGRLTAMSAQTGFDSLKHFYAAAGAGKELFAVLDVGINPNVEHVPGAWITSPVAAGMVTLGIGRNTWAGGDNDVSFGIPLYLPGSTLSVDGTRMIVDGKLALPPQMERR